MGKTCLDREGERHRWYEKRHAHGVNVAYWRSGKITSLLRIHGGCVEVVGTEVIWMEDLES